MLEEEGGRGVGDQYLHNFFKYLCVLCMCSSSAASAMS